MKNSIVSIATVAATLISLGSFAQTQEKQEKKVQKTVVVTNVNGKTQVIKSDSGADLPEDVKKKMAEMGVNEKFTYSFNTNETVEGDSSKKVIVFKNCPDDCKEESCCETVRWEGKPGDEIPADIKAKMEEMKQGKNMFFFNTDETNVDGEEFEIEIETNGTEGSPNIMIFKSNGEKMEMGDGANVEWSEETKDGVKTVRVVVSHKLVIEDLTSGDKLPESLKLDSKNTFGDNLTDLTFSPNPSNGKFTVRFGMEKKGDARVAIYDMQGKTIYTEQLPNFVGTFEKEIDLTSQPKGIYLLNIQQGKRNMTKKLVLE